MIIQNPLLREMHYAHAAEEFVTAVLRDIRHESPEIFDPGIVPVPMEEVDMRIIILLAEMFNVAHPALLIVETEDADFHLELLLDL